MFKRGGLVCAVVTVFVLLIARAQAPNPSNPWTSQWITAPGAPERDAAVLHFRKELDLAEAPKHFRIDVSADNQFILYVNQRRVGSGPNRSVAHWRYETYDLRRFLHAGKNVLAATVWNFGTQAALAQISDRIGFLVHGEGIAEHVADPGTS